MGNPSPGRTAGFKQKAVGPRRKSGTTRAEAARGPGCDAGSLSDWARKTDAAGPAPDANPFRTAEGLRRPRRENETLSKASALFAGGQLQAFPRRGRSQVRIPQRARLAGVGDARGSEGGAPKTLMRLRAPGVRARFPLERLHALRSLCRRGNQAHMGGIRAMVHKAQRMWCQ